MNQIIGIGLDFADVIPVKILFPTGIVCGSALTQEGKIDLHTILTLLAFSSKMVVDYFSGKSEMTILFGPENTQ